MKEKNENPLHGRESEKLYCTAKEKLSRGHLSKIVGSEQTNTPSLLESILKIYEKFGIFYFEIYF